MGLSFPTGQTKSMTSRTGQPLRPEARHLCHHSAAQRIVDEYGSCQLCGRYPPEVVKRTWHERAQQIAARGHARRATA